MSPLRVKLAVLAFCLLLSGCMPATYEATNTANFKPRDKEYLANIRYANVPVAVPFRRAIVEYHPSVVMHGTDTDDDILLLLGSGGLSCGVFGQRFFLVRFDLGD